MMAFISTAVAQEQLVQPADTNLVQRITILEQKLNTQSVELEKIRTENRELKKQVETIRTNGLSPSRKKKAVVERRGSKQVTWQ